MRHSVLAALLSLLFTLGDAGGDETRVALVIGNDAYDALPDLNNAARDARGLSARLETLGFRTTLMPRSQAT